MGAAAEPAARPDAARWHVWEGQRVLGRLGATPAGLTTAEADRRRERYGRNELDLAPPARWWAMLGRQFLSPLIGILVIALAVVVLLAEWVDAGAVLLVLVLNVGIGFWQERKAETAVRALQRLQSPGCRVLRDGGEVALAAAELVPGDVVLLESGERVPADLRLLDATGMQVDESMLTGEALPVVKSTEALPASTPPTERVNLVFSGTLVTTGRAAGVVVGTGGRTELGQISALVQGAGTRSPLEVLTHRLERWIGVVVAVGAGFVFVAGMVLGHAASEMFRTAVALAVASVPESLPVVLTVAMSVGVARMARRNAIVRSLPAVETLGSTTVIGSDKTGTLTVNRLTVRSLWTPAGSCDIAGGSPGQGGGPFAALLRTGALTNEAVTGPDGALMGDAVDVAIAVAALDHGAVTRDERAEQPLGHTPYEPELSFCQTVRKEPDGRRVLHVKGSPEVLVAMSTSLGDGPMDAGRVRRANERLAADGMRVLAVARRNLGPDEVVGEELPQPADLELLGLLAMEDPPRPGVPEAVQQCRRAGISVVIITGDHPATAAALARRIGLPTAAEPLTGVEMTGLDDAVLAARVRAAGVVARVTPQDKLRVVRALHDDGEVVAVTGDGVNDAPALKAASIGVAMGRSGTDVAREAADIVLTDDDFVTVVDAVRQGRITFSAIRNATFFLLASGLASLVAVSANVLAEGPLLFLPVQLLFINVVTNGLQDIALGFEPGERDVLDRPPRPRSEGILSRTLWFRLLVAGLWMAVALLVAFRWALQEHGDVVHARTFAVTLFVMMNFYLVGAARSETRSIFAMNPFGNRMLIVTSLGALALHLGAMSWSVSAGVLGLTPLSAREWVMCAVAGLSVLVIAEGDKLVRAWWRRREPSGPARVRRRLPSPRA